MYFMILHKSFHEDRIVLNPGKCQYTVIIDNDPSHKIILNNNGIASSNEKKLLGIISDSKLSFDSHITLFVKEQAKHLVLLQK